MKVNNKKVTESELRSRLLFYATDLRVIYHT